VQLLLQVICELRGSMELVEKSDGYQGKKKKKGMTALYLHNHLCFWNESNAEV